MFGLKRVILLFYLQWINGIHSISVVNVKYVLLKNQYDNLNNFTIPPKKKKKNASLLFETSIKPTLIFFC